jgi:DNA-directed RNA polymerase specialized sigma24 family protein
MKDKSDADLALAYQQGDETALEELLRRYKARLKSLDMRWNNIHDLWEKESTILRACEKAIRIWKPDKSACVSTFVQLVVMRALGNAHKSAYNAPWDSLDELDVFGKPPIELLEQPDTSQPIDYDYIESRLAKLNGLGLSVFERKVLQTLMLGGTYKQAGKRLGVSGKTVDTAYQRIRDKVIRQANPNLKGYTAREIRQAATKAGRAGTKSIHRAKHRATDR